MTSRTVSVPNDVVNGETSGICSTRSSKPSRVTDAAGRAMGMRSGYARGRGERVARRAGAARERGHGSWYRCTGRRSRRSRRCCTTAAVRRRDLDQLHLSGSPASRSSIQMSASQRVRGSSACSASSHSPAGCACPSRSTATQRRPRAGSSPAARRRRGGARVQSAGIARRTDAAGDRAQFGMPIAMRSRARAPASQPSSANARTGNVPKPSTAGGAAVKRAPRGGSVAEVREVLDDVHAGGEQQRVRGPLAAATRCRRC